MLVSDDVVFTRGALDEFLQFARGGLAVEVEAVAPTVEGKAEKPATKAEKPVEAGRGRGPKTTLLTPTALTPKTPTT